MKKRLIALSAALTLTAALSGTTFAGDASQWGARKVNEYEGQHRASGVPTTAGKDPEIPVSPNLAKKGSFDITAGGTGKGGEDVPVTPGIAFNGEGAGKVSWN